MQHIITDLYASTHIKRIKIILPLNTLKLHRITKLGHKEPVFTLDLITEDLMRTNQWISFL